MRCDYCGRPIKPGEWQCPGCGAPVEYGKEEAERRRQAEEAERQRQAEEAERRRQAEEAERRRQAEEAERQRQAEEAERQAQSQWQNSTHYNLYQKYGEVGPDAYGGLVIRTIAMLIDAVVLSVLIAIPVIGTLGGLAYVILGDSHIFNGQTIGRRIMHLRVVNLDYETISIKRSICRNLCKGFTLYMGGFITVPFSRRKRAVHDLLCGTCVIKTN